MRNVLKLLLLFSVVTFTAAVSADEMRDSLFEKADAALKKANSLDANVLTPVSYAKASELYQRADDRFKKGKSIEKIKLDLSQAVSHYKKAIKSVELAAVTFDTSINARKDALTAKADEYATAQWQEAEIAFAVAAKRLEGGNVKSASKKSAKAEELYRVAELAAIKANYLNETRNLIAKAKKEKVYKYAPRTLKNAEALLMKAEKALSDNRYDLDQPRSLAREAKYEANHAIHIASKVLPLARGDVEPEDVVLAMEQPVVRVAGTLDLVAELDGQSEDPMKNIMDKIAQLQMQAYELGEAQKNIQQLETEMTILEERLGVQNERLAKQEKRRAQFGQVNDLFDPAEAIVLTKGSDILIRMVGLNFKPGKSTVETQYFSLLAKVQKALNVFPNAPVIVEGHTDSFGGDAINMQISRDRAEAVRSYLLANMPGRTNMSILSEGYGETKPIGNNETAEGRTKNRRIDLVIKTL